QTQAVVLCAGVGSRLRPVTNHVPKCLVRVGGKPILQYQLEALRACGILDVTIVSGYRSHQVQEFLRGRFDDMKIQIVTNEDYATTNNMYSLYLVRDRLDSPMVLLNGDIVFDPFLLRRLLDNPAEDSIAVFPGVHVDESMKVTVSKDGHITGISKRFGEAEAHGISLDLYRFSAKGARALRKEVEGWIETRGDRKQWTEVALHDLLARREIPVKPVDVGGSAWIEIDNFEDLQQAEFLFNPVAREIRSKDVIFFDGDGTLYVDGQLLPGAKEIVAWLRANERKVYFLTNNSSKSKADYVRRLAEIGIPFSANEVVTSTDMAIEYLRNRRTKGVFAVGTPGFVEDLERAGISTTSETPDTVIVAFDTTLTYEKLKRACLLIEGGAHFVATHGDRVCPTREGGIPDAGAIIALIETATQVSPVVLGKPHERMILAKLEEIGAAPERVLHVGDRLSTDIHMGRRAGVETVCVLSGEATREEIELSRTKPDLIINDLRGLLLLLARGENSVATKGIRVKSRGGEPFTNSQ
ncbi:MAG TPA: HAD-IIA family hydrolase, partial [Candidatus Thermoplasmatota archaeon]|nr:HAD-IIA family hydrolase [Candidatus Thermoplasmatota archaeon]